MEGGLGSTRSGDSAVQPALKCLSWTDAFQSETIRVSGNGPRCAEAFKPLPTAVTPGGGGSLVRRVWIQAGPGSSEISLGSSRAQLSRSHPTGLPGAPLRGA